MYAPPNQAFPSSAPQHHCAFEMWLSKWTQICCLASSAATASKTYIIQSAASISGWQCPDTDLQSCRFRRKPRIALKNLVENSRPILLAESLGQCCLQSLVGTVAVYIVDHLDGECESHNVHVETLDQADDILHRVVLESFRQHGVCCTRPVDTSVHNLRARR